MFYFEYEESQFVLHNLYGKKEITVRIGNIDGGSAKGQNHLETFWDYLDYFRICASTPRDIP